MAPSTRTLFASPSASESAATNDSKFRQFVNKKRSLDLKDYFELHAWSTTELNDFWTDVWEFSDVIGVKEDLVGATL